jgi:integrase
MKGDNIADVSNQLGHHSIKFTMDIYYHWMPGGKKEEIDALDDWHFSAPYTHPEAKKELGSLPNSLIFMAGATRLELATSGVTGRPRAYST